MQKKKRKVVLTSGVKANHKDTAILFAHELWEDLTEDSHLIFLSMWLVPDEVQKNCFASFFVMTLLEPTKPEGQSSVSRLWHILGAVVAQQAIVVSRRSHIGTPSVCVSQRGRDWVRQVVCIKHWVGSGGGTQLQSSQATLNSLKMHHSIALHCSGERHTQLFRPQPTHQARTRAEPMPVAGKGALQSVRCLVVQLRPNMAARWGSRLFWWNTEIAPFYCAALQWGRSDTLLDLSVAQQVKIPHHLSFFFFETRQFKVKWFQPCWPIHIELGEKRKSTTFLTKHKQENSRRRQKFRKKNKKETRKKNYTKMKHPQTVTYNR